MSRYIGSTGAIDTFPKYFYRLYRDDTGYLTFTKVDMNSDTDTVVINDNSLMTNETDQQSFDISNDVVVVNIDANHEVINKAAGHSQYKIKPDDLLYFINENGDLIVRINGSYSYPSVV